MNLQERRTAFIESNPGLAETKTPLKILKKMGEEGKECFQAAWTYFKHPTEENRNHLGEEIADVVFLFFDLATMAHINLQERMEAKLTKDTMRFPPGSVMKKEDYRQRKILLGERRGTFFRR